jgi:hypothetical protein
MRRYRVEFADVERAADVEHEVRVHNGQKSAYPAGTYKRPAPR